MRNYSPMIKLGLECIWVLIPTVLHGFAAEIVIVLRVATIVAVASITILFSSKANTVELKTIRFLAIAQLWSQIFLVIARALAIS